MQLSFEQTLERALSRRTLVADTDNAQLASVCRELAEIEKNDFAELVERECIGTVEPTAVSDGVWSLSAELCSLPDARQDTHKALQRLFSSMVSAAAIDTALSGRQKKALIAEEALSQL